MSNKVEKILAFAIDFEKEAIDSLVAEAKKKEKKKLDPKAKVRNRGTVCVPAESAKDNKDHFPINDADQARNALARVHQYSSVPEWYKGNLSGLQALVARKVKAKYPKIDVGGKKEKKSSEYYDHLINKFAQEDPNTVVTFLKMNIIPSLQAMKSKLQKLIEGEAPGSGRKGTVDAAIMQLDNALGQASQAQREAMKDKTSEDLNRYLSDITKYFGYAQTYAKNETGVMDTQLQGYIDAAIQYAKGLGDGTQPATQQQTPAAKPQPTARPKSRYPAIDTVFQTMLGVNPDGALGPLTQSALEMYKKSIGLPYGADEATRKTDSNKNNQQAFESLKQRPEYKTRRAMEYDDTSNVYKQPAGGIVRESPF